MTGLIGIKHRGANTTLSPELHLYLQSNRMKQHNGLFVQQTQYRMNNTIVSTMLINCSTLHLQ